MTPHFISANCRIIISAVLLNIAVLTSAFARGDTSSIYITKQQFDSGHAAYSCKCRVQEKAGIFWSDFMYHASGELRVNTKNNGNRWLEGSIYGFYMNGIKFVFMPAEKKYMAVLSNKLPLPLFVIETEHVGYRSYFRNGLIVYINPVNGQVTELTKRNLRRDFESGTKLLDEMLKLDAKLEKYKDYISRKNFFKCQLLTEEASL